MPPAGRPTSYEPSAAGRSWKGGARERADDVFFASVIKRRRSNADFAPTWYARRDSNSAIGILMVIILAKTGSVYLKQKTFFVVSCLIVLYVFFLLRETKRENLLPVILIKI